MTAIGETKWYPPRGQNRIGAMVESRPDWVLSRQRAWGVPLAIFVHKESGKILDDPAVKAMAERLGIHHFSRKGIPRYNQPTGQFYHLATDDRFPYWIYGAQQDSGAAATPVRTDWGTLSSRDVLGTRSRNRRDCEAIRRFSRTLRPITRPSRVRSNGRDAVAGVGN